MYTFLKFKVGNLVKMMPTNTMVKKYIKTSFLNRIRRRKSTDFFNLSLSIDGGIFSIRSQEREVLIGNG